MEIKKILWRLSPMIFIPVILSLCNFASAQIPPVSQAEVDCEATLVAWGHDADPQIREYMATHDCSCANGPHRSPVCIPKNSGNNTGETQNDEEYNQNENYQQQQQNQALEKLQKEKEFQEKKNELEGRLKGSTGGEVKLKTGNESNTGLPLKTGTGSPTALPLKTGNGPTTGLPLKTGTTASNPLMRIETEEDLQKVRDKVADLQMDVKIMQNQLKLFSKDLLNNSGEFEVWAEMVDRSAKSALENGKGFARDLFLQYGLGAYLEKSVQQGIWKKLDELIYSTDPEMRLFIGREIKSRHVELDAVKKISDHIKLTGDVASLYTSDEEGWKQSLDALLLVNDLFEAYKISNAAFQKTPAGQFFGQAKVTGQAIADFSSVAYSWLSINRLTKENEQYARDINSLSIRMEASVKQINCLNTCLAAYTEGCVDKCAGKTRFTTPPPPLR